MENATRPLAIDHEDRVLTGVTVRAGHALGTLRNPGLSFHILRFDPNGKPDLTLSLPTDTWHDNLIYLDAADDIIAWANGKIQLLLAKDEAHAKPENWTTLATCSGLCLSLQSQSRQTLAFLYLRETDDTLVIQGTPPRLKETCPFVPVSFDAITDEFGYGSESKIVAGKHHIKGITFRYRWPLCHYGHSRKLPLPDNIVGPISPITDQSIFGLLPTHTGVVFAPDGQVKRTLVLPVEKNEVIWLPRFSNGGSRVVMSARTLVGGLPSLDISPRTKAQHMIVYDMTTGKVLARVPVSTRWLLTDFTISPDGHVVAAVEGPYLVIARVP